MVIPSVLADRQQNFDTAQKAQARDNIGAMAASASGDYYPYIGNPSGFLVPSSITGKQDITGMSAYVPFTAISSDTASAITSINGSSVGGAFTGISADSNFTGNGTQTSALGLNTAVDITKGVYSAHIQYSNLQFGDDSGHSSTLSRVGLTVREDGSNSCYIKPHGFSANGAVDVALTNTSNGLHPSGLYIREANGSAGTATLDSNKLRLVQRGFRGSPLSSYSSDIASLEGDGLSITYEKQDSAKNSAYLTYSSLKFSANDTSNTAYLPTSMYAMSGIELRFFDADIGHDTQTNITYSGIRINASSNYHITDIGPSSIVMRNAWSPATHSAMHDCYGSRWSSTAGDWCYVEPRRVYFGTGNEVSAQYIDNAKVKSYDAVNKLMSSLSAWATAQGWTPS